MSILNNDIEVFSELTEMVIITCKSPYTRIRELRAYLTDHYPQLQPGQKMYSKNFITIAVNNRYWLNPHIEFVAQIDGAIERWRMDDYNFVVNEKNYAIHRGRLEDVVRNTADKREDWLLFRVPVNEYLKVKQCFDDNGKIYD